jgi:hypothetical protein
VTVDLFGAGERATLSLAAERSWIALINEWRAAAHGRDILGLQVINVPQLIVAVCAAGHIQRNKGHLMLSKIANITSAALMQDATRVLNELP